MERESRDTKNNKESPGHFRCVCVCVCISSAGILRGNKLAVKLCSPVTDDVLCVSVC